MTGEDFKNKKEYRFYILRPGDGRYVFKCNSPRQRDEWTMMMNKIITVRPHVVFVSKNYCFSSENQCMCIVCKVELCKYICILSS